MNTGLGIWVPGLPLRGVLVNDFRVERADKLSQPGLIDAHGDDIHGGSEGQ
jgi:hypothetical protein